ncbi:hypothetical protein [Pelomonas sp. SE-A7]|uniref:substrate-binding periplasmic protein n=1 Tax=Pelomonas sp. SE-A7 TaxID=3054953 RepID=UPI00259D0B44|nr:hypothetical protein [Pelomonas sp. SE-A7]MDM4768460.1 hypothetical protein [Pelomonas sp. SE-A7]
MSLSLNRRQSLAATAALCGSLRSPAQPAPVLRHMELLPQDDFGRYVVELMGLALQRSGLPHRLEPVPSFQISQGRVELEMSQARSRLDLVWSMTSRAREQAILPLRVPLDRGLLGWRVALVRRADLAQWQKAPLLTELAQRRGGQGLHWPDLEILRANGLSVDTAIDAPHLLEMLSKRRIDYFPRSVLEVQGELKTYAQLDLAVAPGFVLRYPTASYAFLRPQLSELLPPLSQALEALIKDGSLDRLFRRHFQPRLAALELGRRRVIELKNPLLPPQTPLQRSEFWWQAGSPPP